MPPSRRAAAVVLVAAALTAFALGRPYVAFVCACIAACLGAAASTRHRPRIAAVIRRVVLFPPPATRPPRDAAMAVQALALVALVATLAAPRWRRPPPLSALYDDHTWTSLNIAVARARCGSVSAVAAEGDVAAYLSSHPEATTTPLLQLASFDCRSLRPLVISQNTLMLVETATLRLRPGASLATIGRLLMAFHAASIALFAVVLTVVGAPLAFCGVAIAAMDRAAEAATAQYAYAIYPLMVPAVALVAALAAIVPPPRLRARDAAAAFALGVTIAVLGNLRSDLLLFCGAGAGVAAAVRTRSLRAFALHVAALAAGVAVFAAIWIRPIERTQPGRLTGHPVMHPIVLALAVPDNAVARQLGLRWDDNVGFALAHRLEPGVNVLTSDYERVLRRYYFALWREHPRAMLNIYRIKFLAAARSFVVDSTGIGFDTQFWRAVLRPLGGRGTGGALVPTLLGVAVIGGIAASARWPHSWTVPLTMFAIAGALNWVEAAAVFSHFTLQYYAVAFVVLVACCVGLYQAVLQLALNSTEPAPAARAHTASPSSPA